MTALNLRRFSRPGALRSIRPSHLTQLLSPHADFFTARGVALSSNGTGDGLDYEGLARVFMTPDSDTPDDLANALYFVHEMATPDGMDELLEEATYRGILLDGDPDPTPADVAIQV